MTPDLRAAFQEQSRSCEALGSPFMGQLCRVLGARLERGTPLTERLFDWRGDLGPRGDSVPLRLCGALHGIVLRGDAPLGAVYPPARVGDDDLWDGVASALSRHAAFVADFIDSPPQTNEVRRAAALIAAGHVVAHHRPNPIRLSELGASAGLNLNWDHFALKIAHHTFGAPDAPVTLAPDWSGPLPPHNQPQIVARGGVDLNPLDPVADRLRLLAYLWADQPERLILTDAAMALPPAPVARGDAIEWLEPRLRPVAGQTHLIYTTIAWQYFPAAKQAKGLAMIEDAGRRATPDSPLAFVQMENDGAAKGAALTLRLWPGDRAVTLGRVDFHGRWIEWAG